MPAKKRKLSPAKERELAKEQKSKDSAPCKAPTWPQWQTKVQKVRKRNLSKVCRGWLAHVPDIESPGCAPRETIGTIADINDALNRVPIKGELIEPLNASRDIVLHEGYYLAHKAIHVEMSCARAVKQGFHTWAIVDAYQASLFALGSIMCLLGLTVERHNNDFILLDVWGANPHLVGDLPHTDYPQDQIHFIRFKTLDHYHKWALLKRTLRTLETDLPLVTFLNEALTGRDEKEFSKHRNNVHYISNHWIADDLLEIDPHGPVRKANTCQHVYEHIVQGTPAGAVYLMCGLIELICEITKPLTASQILKHESNLLDRRLEATKGLIEFDWNTLLTDRPWA
tara:strand:- start:801 stop:1823 length:1023 start_codon:yes stop_codon:yes gene_type:complete